MNTIERYLIAPEELDAEAIAQLKPILERYPWFTTARWMRARATGNLDSSLQIHLALHPAPAGLLCEPTACAFSEDNTIAVIDQFLASGEHRIKAPEQSESTLEDISLDSVAEDADLVSEELAEIYLKQGLFKQASAIYTKLSLLYPEKSVYFAEILVRASSQRSAKNT